jgi:hypothetical protein
MYSSTIVAIVVVVVAVAIVVVVVVVFSNAYMCLGECMLKNFI